MKRALIELLETRSLEDLSISDIAEKAMIYRTTFYSHCPDKYFLLEEYLAEAWEEEIELKKISRDNNKANLNLSEEFWKDFLNTTQHFKKIFNKIKDIIRKLIILISRAPLI